MTISASGLCPWGTISASRLCSGGQNLRGDRICSDTGHQGVHRSCQCSFSTRPFGNACRSILHTLPVLHLTELQVPSHVPTEWQALAIISVWLNSIRCYKCMHAHNFNLLSVFKFILHIICIHVHRATYC